MILTKREADFMLRLYGHHFTGDITGYEVLAQRFEAIHGHEHGGPLTLSVVPASDTFYGKRVILTLSTPPVGDIKTEGNVT
tara:strand:+ start:74 stop:316 length:243 start_codon:yes stop_codon:yes gene_type:complete